MSDKMPTTRSSDNGSTSGHGEIKQRKWFKWLSGCFRPVDRHNHRENIIEEKSVPETTLVQVSVPVRKGISKFTFDKEIFPHSLVAAGYFWNFFTRYSEKEIGNGLEISAAQMDDGAEKIFAQITDREQIQFYVKIFANGRSSIDRRSFSGLLLSAFDLGLVAQQLNGTSVVGNFSTVSPRQFGEDYASLASNEWIEAVINSCFHLKPEMSVVFICNWMQTNLPRALVLMNKYVTYQLTSAQAHAQHQETDTEHKDDLSVSPTPSSPSATSTISVNNQFITDSKSVPMTPPPGTADSNLNRKRVSVTGINPFLLWLLEVSLPPTFASPLEKKPEALSCPFTRCLTPQQLLSQLLNQAQSPEPWSKLYDSSEQGTSVNRFQYNLYHYKGPTLMFIFAENNYTLCVGSDEEWKESSKFWGSEDSFLLQLQPEFRFVERGPKLLYTNFTIRGYPFGIQVGKDTKDITLEIKPDFQLVSFKGIPCRINQIIAFGCGSKQVKSAQAEYKKWENKQCELQRVIKRNRSEWTDDPDNYLLQLGSVHTSYARGNNLCNSPYNASTDQNKTPRCIGRVSYPSEVMDT